MYCGGLAPEDREARRNPDNITEAEIADGYITEGCGRTIELPADREDRATWDVRTEVTNGIEFVVERWHVVRCPFCGYEGDENKISEAPEKPIPFELHEPAMEWARAVRLNELNAAAQR